MEYPSQKRTRQDFPRNSLHWKQLTVACGTQGLYQATVQAQTSATLTGCAGGKAAGTRIHGSAV